MSSTGIGFYEDVDQLTTIIESAGNFLSQPARQDATRGGEYRLTDGSLEQWEIYEKMQESLVFSGVRQTDRDILKTEYDLNRTFFYFPDPINNPTVSFEVVWARGWVQSYNKNDERYTINLTLKEI